MYDMPVWFFGLVAFIFGTIMGSFLDVFVSRFHTGKSINGRSHCTACGHVLDWYELFPLFSYLFLRGRCLICRAHIPVRLFLMEILTGTLFVLVYLGTDNPVDLVFGLVLTMMAIIITHYDVRHLLIPNEFVIAVGVLALLRLVHEWWFLALGEAIVPYVISGVLAALFYASLWLISKGQWIGLGDAKLALPLGIMLSAEATFSFVVLSFWVGAAVSVFLLGIHQLLKRGQTHLRFLSIPLTMKSEVPFAPFLLLAFALVYFYTVDVLSLFSIIV